MNGKIMTADELVEHGLYILPGREKPSGGRTLFRIFKWPDGVVGGEVVYWSGLTSQPCSSYESAQCFFLDEEARRAATEIVRRQAKPKIEKALEVCVIGREGIIRQDDLRLVTYPDGSRQLAQRLSDDFAPVVEFWTEENYRLWGMPDKTRAAYNEAQRILKTQQLIRECENE